MSKKVPIRPIILFQVTVRCPTDQVENTLHYISNLTTTDPMCWTSRDMSPIGEKDIWEFSFRENPYNDLTFEDIRELLDDSHEITGFQNIFIALGHSPVDDRLVDNE